MSNRVAKEFPNLAQYAKNYTTPESYAGIKWVGYINANTVIDDYKLYGDTTVKYLKNTTPYMVNKLNWWTNSSHNSLSLDYTHPFMGEATIKWDLATADSDDTVLTFYMSDYPATGVACNHNSYDQTFQTLPGYFTMGLFKKSKSFLNATVSIDFLWYDNNMSITYTLQGIPIALSSYYAQANQSLHLPLNVDKSKITSRLGINIRFNTNNEPSVEGKQAWFTMPKFYYIDGVDLDSGGSDATSTAPYLVNGLGGVF